jgi:hypothetical protein
MAEEEHKPRMTVDDLVRKRLATDHPGKKLTKRQYLTREAIEAGADIWTAIEAVSSTAMEHPEWDMEEKKTREEWDRG